jgi:predicted DNA-binding transcriptional regulator AlpA
MYPVTFVIYDDFEKHGIPRYSRRHINAMVDAGTFPPPVRLTSIRLAWTLCDLERWKATRPPAHERPPVLWPPQDPPRGRGMAGFTAKPVGRRKGARIVTDTDGHRRVVMPEGFDAAD